MNINVEMTILSILMKNHSNALIVKKEFEDEVTLSQHEKERRLLKNVKKSKKKVHEVQCYILEH